MHIVDSIAGSVQVQGCARDAAIGRRAKLSQLALADSPGRRKY